MLNNHMPLLTVAASAPPENECFDPDIYVYERRKRTRVHAFLQHPFAQHATVILSIWLLSCALGSDTSRYSNCHSWIIAKHDLFPRFRTDWYPPQIKGSVVGF